MLLILGQRRDVKHPFQCLIVFPLLVIKLTLCLDVLFYSYSEAKANPWIQLIHRMLILEDRNVDDVESALEDILQHNDLSPAVSNCYLALVCLFVYKAIKILSYSHLVLNCIN
jgi:hypothetical protein